MLDEVGEIQSDKLTNIPQPTYTTVKDFYHNDVIPTDPVIVKKVKRKILKNLMLISVVFMLNFTAYNGLGNLQSSLHIDQGMGTITQSIVYSTQLLSSMFLPKLMTSTVGAKWTMPIGIAGYMVWMAANGYAVWGTMVPASILVGLSAGPLWTAQKIYFSKLVPKYAQLLGEREEVVMARIFGIFFGVFQISNLIGSLISSLVLGSDDRSNNNTLTNEEIQEHCGVNDCPWNNVTNPNESQPSSSTLWTLVGVYLCVAFLGLLIVCIWVDELPRYLRDDKEAAKKQVKRALIEAVLYLRHRAMLLLIVISIFNGLENGFYGAEWNNSFVSCSLGIWMVGYIAVPASVVTALSSFLGGYFLKYIKRIPIFTTGFVIHLSFHFSLLFWPLNQDQKYVFYILATLRSVADGIYQTQINALYGTIAMGNSEAAFSDLKIWESIGNIMAFGYSSFICTSIKLYILMSLLVVGMVMYYIVEWLEAPKIRARQEAVDAARETLNDDAEPHINGSATNSGMEIYKRVPLKGESTAEWIGSGKESNLTRDNLAFVVENQESVKAMPSALTGFNHIIDEVAYL